MKEVEMVEVKVKEIHGGDVVGDLRRCIVKVKETLREGGGNAYRHGEDTSRRLIEEVEKMHEGGERDTWRTCIVNVEEAH